MEKGLARETASDTTIAPAITASDPTIGAGIPRIKLLPHGYAIDHADPDAGERLMAEALGVTDREAMDGILRQLVRASADSDGLDATNLAFMLSMVKRIKPRDTVEAMLVAQMVSVHVMTMRCAQNFATSGDYLRQDSAARAMGRLARTFPAQIDALNRYRSRSEPAITVQHVSVADGGNAIVGNVTQHANVIVKDKRAAAARRARRAKRRREAANARRETQA